MIWTTQLSDLMRSTLQPQTAYYSLFESHTEQGITCGPIGIALVQDFTQNSAVTTVRLFPLRFMPALSATVFLLNNWFYHIKFF